MKAVYDALVKRTSTFTVGICLSVFFFERAFDVASDSIFKSINKGVSIEYTIWYNYVISQYFHLLQKLWEDIKGKYE